MTEIDAAIARSIEVVSGTNEYFSRDRVVAPPVLRPGLPVEAAPDEREAFDEAAESAIGAEGLLHDETVGLLVVNGEAAQLIAGLVQTQLDERLSPTRTCSSGSNPSPGPARSPRCWRPSPPSPRGLLEGDVDTDRGGLRLEA